MNRYQVFPDGNRFKVVDTRFDVVMFWTGDEVYANGMAFDYCRNFSDHPRPVCLETFRADAESQGEVELANQRRQELVDGVSFENQLPHSEVVAMGRVTRESYR